MKTNDFIEIKKDSTFIFSYFKEENNTAIIPSTATISLIDTANNAIITDQAMTINTTTGEVTYSWDSSSQDVGQNYQVLFKIDSYDTVVRFFDIYFYPFVNDITDDDLIQENETIKEGTWQSAGKAESGSTSTLVDAGLKGDPETWTGGLIEIYQSNEIHSRKITTFDNTTGTITFSPVLTTAVTTENYSIRKSYQDRIDIAGLKVQKDFRALNKRAYLVIDHMALKWLIIYKFFQDYFGNLVKELDDEYDIQRNRYADLYKNEFQSLSLVYDKDANAEIDTDEEVDEKVGEVRWLR